MTFQLTVFIFIASLSVTSQNSLDYYVSASKKNSPLIADNQNQSKANQLEAERLKAFYTKPQIGLTANYLFAPIINLDGGTPKFEANTAGASDYRGYDIAISNSGQYQALLNITQPLFNAKKLQLASAQVNITSQINQNAVRISGHDLEKVITDQYILCLQDYKQIDYASSMLDILTEQKKLVQKLVESSIYKQSDLSLLSLETQNFQLQLTAFNANYKRDLMDLNIMCGINDTAFVRLSDPALSISAPVAGSMYYEKYRLDSLALVATNNTFNIKYRPQLNVFANTGLNAVYAPTILKRYGANAGLSFSYYFYDGKQKSIMKHKTDALLQSVSAYKENFTIQNSVRKAKILSELQSYSPRIAISEQQLSEYQTLMGLYKKEILTGQLSIINYITTLKNMAAVQRDNALLYCQKLILINAYNYWNW